MTTLNLKDLKRYVVRKGKTPNGEWKDKSNWLTYEEAKEKAKYVKNGGVSIVLGKLNEEYSLVGIDIDTIIDKENNKMDENIKEDIKPFTNKHLSMSGYGIHILCLMKNDSLVKNSKKNLKSNLKINRIEDGKQKFPEIEFYTHGKLFAIPNDYDITKGYLEDMTYEYLRIYNKYANDNIKKELEDESAKDFAFCLDLVKKGFSDEEIIKLFYESDLYKQKDEFHKKKIERPDYLPRTIAKARKLYENENNSFSKLENVLNLIKMNDVFIDERDDAYLMVDYDNIRIESNNFIRYITCKCIENKINANKYTLTQAQDYLMYKARKESPKYNLNVRFAGDKNTIYYQLNKKEIVKITPNKYEIINNDVPMFKWFSKKMGEQVKPQASNITYKDLLSQFNIGKEQKLLFLVYLVSLFVPNIPKVILIIIAEAGAGKTTTTNFIKNLVDPAPSNHGIQDLPNDKHSLAQIMDHSALVCFDNLEKIQVWQSNDLCRAYSGDSFSKKKNYTDEDDIVWQFKRAIILNGINCPATREDLLDRSVLIKLNRIDKTKSKTTEKIYHEWNELKPKFLDLIFRTISIALSLYDTIDDDKMEYGRNADWCKWGFAIAQAIGIEMGQDNFGERFLLEYNQNIANQKIEVIENNVLVQTIIQFMSNQKYNRWEGLATDLFQQLKELSMLYGNDYGFPKNASWLTREINRYLSILETQNIKFTKKQTNIGSKYILEKIK